MAPKQTGATLELGDSVKYDKNGRTFVNKELAANFLREQELPADVWGIYEDGGGWVVMKHAYEIQRRADMKAAREQQQQQQQATKERFFLVQFPERPDSTHPLKVACYHNGNVLMCSRGVPVALPERYVNALKCAVSATFEPSNDPTVAVRRAGNVNHRPFQLIRECSREEWEKSLAEGNAITRDAVAAAGGDVSQIHGDGSRV